MAILRTDLGLQCPLQVDRVIYNICSRVVAEFTHPELYHDIYDFMIYHTFRYSNCLELCVASRSATKNT